MHTAEQLRAFVDTYCATVNSRDVDAYVALWDPDGVQHDPTSSPPRVGTDAIREFWSTTVAGAEAIDFAARRVHASGDHVAIDFSITVTLATGPMTIEGIEVFELGEDDKIRSATAVWGDDDLTFA